MVAVGMGDEDVGDGLVLDRIEQRADVALVGGTGIDDGDVAAADDVTHRALEGERARVVAHDPAHAGHHFVHRLGGEIELLVEGDVVGHADPRREVRARHSEVCE